jgi:hypothetical protein
MRRFLTLATIAAAAAAPGCATYSSSRLAHEGAAARAPEIFGDIEARNFGKRVQVKLPSELVIAEVRADSGRQRQGKADKRAVQVADALAADRATFSNVEPLFIDDGSAKYEDLRATASRHRADLMLVASLTERVSDENGALAGLSKLLVLPCFLVPTETDDLSLHLRVAVVDVRNDLVYATFEDHREERVHATAAGERDAVEAGFDRLYADSLAKLRGRVVERLRSLERADDASSR